MGQLLERESGAITTVELLNWKWVLSVPKFKKELNCGGDLIFIFLLFRARVNPTTTRRHHQRVCFDLVALNLVQMASRSEQLKHRVPRMQVAANKVTSDIQNKKLEQRFSRDEVTCVCKQTRPTDRLTD